MKKRNLLSFGLLLSESLLIIGMIVLMGWLISRYLYEGEEQKIGLRTEIETEIETAAGKINETESMLSDQPLVRVQILTEDFQKKCHDHIEVVCEQPYTVNYLDENLVEKQHLLLKAGEPFFVDTQRLKENEILLIEPGMGERLQLLSKTCSDGTPEYDGCFYVYAAEGGLVLINEIPVEMYLCGVVSSEMPSYFPVEAQKAQAVCARTYAWIHIRQNEELSGLERKKTADLDDSVMYQVYNNYRATDQSCEAVFATAGQILLQAEPLYYSTSCLSEHRWDLSEEAQFAAFIEHSPQQTEEYESPWLRWEVTLPAEKLQILDRSENGQVQKILLRRDGEEQKIEGEYAIRCALSAVDAQIHLMDGSTVEKMELLPSAFFAVKQEAEGQVTLYGGGYGHGIGMSQCGAAQMASEGKDYQEILDYYYGEEAFSQWSG